MILAKRLTWSAAVLAVAIVSHWQVMAEDANEEAEVVPPAESTAAKVELADFSTLPEDKCSETGEETWDCSKLAQAFGPREVVEKCISENAILTTPAARKAFRPYLEKQMEFMNNSVAGFTKELIHDVIAQTKDDNIDKAGLIAFSDKMLDCLMAADRASCRGTFHHGITGGNGGVDKFMNLLRCRAQQFKTLEKKFEEKLNLAGVWDNIMGRINDIRSKITAKFSKTPAGEDSNDAESKDGEEQAKDQGAASDDNDQKTQDEAAR